MAGKTLVIQATKYNMWMIYSILTIIYILTMNTLLINDYEA